MVQIHRYISSMTNAIGRIINIDIICCRSNVSEWVSCPQDPASSQGSAQPQEV